MKRTICLISVLVLLAALLAGCGAASKSNTYEMAETWAAQAPGMAMAEDMSANAAAGDPMTLPENRKFIITVRMDAETEDLDTLLADLNSKVASLSGYLEDQSIYNGSTYANRRYRSADLTIRIPEASLSEFTEAVRGMSNIVSSSQSAEDVTLNYVDTKSHITALETEQERLLALLEKADSLADVLKIEDRLTDVRYSLEQYASHLRLLDNQIDYATIHMSIEEVQEYTPAPEQTLWQRMSSGFVSSAKALWSNLLDFLAGLVIALPFILFWAVVLFVCITVIRAMVRRSRRAKMAKMAAYRQPPVQAPPQQEPEQQDENK